MVIIYYEYVFLETRVNNGLITRNEDATFQGVKTETKPKLFFQLHNRIEIIFQLLNWAIKTLLLKKIKSICKMLNYTRDMGNFGQNTR